MAKGTIAKDLREKSAEELGELLRVQRSELLAARFDNFTNKLNDTARIRRLRREIARVKTVLGAKGKTATTAPSGSGS